MVNINFTAGKAAMSSAAAQAGLRTVVTSRDFLEKASLELPDGVEVDLDRGRAAHDPDERSSDRAGAWPGWLPIRLIERSAEPPGEPRSTTLVTIIFSSGSKGDPKGVVLTHFNIDSNVESIGQVFRIVRTTASSTSCRCSTRSAT